MSRKSVSFRPPTVSLTAGMAHVYHPAWSRVTAENTRVPLSVPGSECGLQSVWLGCRHKGMLLKYQVMLESTSAGGIQLRLKDEPTTIRDVTLPAPSSLPISPAVAIGKVTLLVG